MVFCEVNKFRLGLKVILDGEPCVILYKEFVKPGKGQAFNRVRLRKLLSNKIIEKTFKSSDSAELANIQELHVLYLYRDDMFFYFMDPVTFEQISVDFIIIQNQNNERWLMAQFIYIITLWDDKPIFITPPNFITLQVINTYSGVKGNTVSSVTKLAVLNTGVVIKVPLFIQIGEYIKVDTRSGVYVSRIK